MKKSTWAYILSATAVIIGGVYFAFTFGLRPEPIPKISWNHFESPSEFGENIYKRLRLEVLSQNLVFLGVMPERENHYKTWKGFLDSLEAENRFEHVIVDSSLTYRNQIPFTEEINLIENQIAVVASIREIIQTKKKVAIVLPTTYISYLVKDNFYTLLTRSLYDPETQTKLDVDWITFSLVGFPLSRDEEKSVDIPCDTEAKDPDGSGALGCMVILKARTLYRKKRVEAKTPAVLDQIGTKEYLGLIN